MGLFGAKTKALTDRLPLLVIEDLVCFPQSVTPLYISNKTGMRGVDRAMNGDRQILIIYKIKDREINGVESFHRVASLCKINQVMRLPNNTSRVLVECDQRVRLVEVFDIFTDPTATWASEAIDNTMNDQRARWMRLLVDSFRIYAGLHKKLASEALGSAEAADAPNRLIDVVCSHASLSTEKKLALFLELQTDTRLEETVITLDAESQLLELKQDVHGRVKKRMEQNQKEYFINEQIKELNRELGKDEDDASWFKDLDQKVKGLPVGEETAARFQSELKRLQRLPPMTPEASIVRTYLELVAELPWGRPEATPVDLTQTQQTLDTDHYDLAEAKDRILDYLAARSYNPFIRAPILCFVGPPGTGKTSLGRSIAKALGRTFVRVSLGGVRDEAEIRGHRRTYVGALPGKIIQGMRKAKQSNTVFLLDEIDKLANDHRGDPSSALLEVLDPEQNYAFSDHYLEVPYDLSQVLFIATANNLQGIPYPLRDRMEIIEVPGYTPFEKKHIATDFIIPKQLKEHGLPSESIRFTDEAIATIIDTYTLEAGVRQLERSIAKTVRKSIRQALTETSTETFQSVEIGAETIHQFLKSPRPRQDIVRDSLPPGLCYGLAWTETGGTVMPIEVILTPGKGELILTGNLGDVMKESARIACSLIRILKISFDLPSTADRDIHIHVPEGAIPKDGPSAGIALTTAVVSALAQVPIRGGLAMTGEITLTGRVLPVGGIREKVLAAHRMGITSVILPEKNRLDARELPPEILETLDLQFVAAIDDVLEAALTKGETQANAIA